jgi:hypothetical protein
MKTLINFYSAVVGKIKFLNDRPLSDWLARTEKQHRSINDFIKKSIRTENLFGVDIMEEATEIARLRLFLALVASAATADDLEPLPNIDFNILPGNSLIGLMRVDDKRFEARNRKGALKIDRNMSMYALYQLPVPRLTAKDKVFGPIVERAARLVCTTAEFDDLAKEVGLGINPSTSSGQCKKGATDPAERARLRAELDGLIARLYGLTEEEFAYILTTFPQVSDPVKVAAHNAYRDVERGLVK